MNVEDLATQGARTPGYPEIFQPQHQESENRNPMFRRRKPNVNLLYVKSRRLSPANQIFLLPQWSVWTLVEPEHASGAHFIEKTHNVCQIRLHNTTTCEHKVLLLWMFREYFQHTEAWTEPTVLPTKLSDAFSWTESYLYTINYSFTYHWLYI